MLAIGAATAIVVVGVGLGLLTRSQHRLRWWSEHLAAHRISLRTYLTGAALASMMWIQDILRLACATRAVGLSLPITELAALSMLAMFGGLVPGVAGLGPVEGSLMVGLVAFNVNPSNAIAATVIERAISYGFSTAGGALVITVISGRSLWTAIRRSPGSPSDATHL